jgi:hypothetical protein
VKNFRHGAVLCFSGQKKIGIGGKAAKLFCGGTTVMRTVLKRTAGIAASLALIASSTAAVAAAPAPAGYQAPNAWMMLTALSPAATLGTASAAAQPADVPPPPPPGPPPPPPVAGAMSGGAGELIPFVLWFGLIAVALTITDKEGLNQATGSPNSAT